MHFQEKGQGSQGDQEHLLQGDPETQAVWRESGRHAADPH